MDAGRLAICSISQWRTAPSHTTDVRSEPRSCALYRGAGTSRLKDCLGQGAGRRDRHRPRRKAVGKLKDQASVKLLFGRRVLSALAAALLLALPSRVVYGQTVAV